MSTPLENRIASIKAKIEVLDSQIGRVMSRRVDMEDKLAAMLEAKNKAEAK